MNSLCVLSLLGDTRNTHTHTHAHTAHCTGDGTNRRLVLNDVTRGELQVGHEPHERVNWRARVRLVCPFWRAMALAHAARVCSQVSVHLTKQCT